MSSLKWATISVKLKIADEFPALNLISLLVADFVGKVRIVLGKVNCYQGGHALTNMFLKKILDSKSSIKVYELKDDVISKKINGSQSIKLAVSA